MNRSKAFLMALLALALHAQGAFVSTEQAGRAALGWARSGYAKNLNIGTSVEKVSTFKLADDVSFYAVKMNGGGTVFMSSDTESEPVVAYTTETNDYSRMSKRSPMWALLTRDATVRANIRKLRAANAVSADRTRSTLSAAKQFSNAARWAKLMDASILATTNRIEDASNIADIRVDSFVKTKWGQTTHNGDVPLGESYEVINPDGTTTTKTGTGILLYNKFTPENMPCGCGATALAQVLEYYCYWDADNTNGKYECIVNGVVTKLPLRPFDGSKYITTVDDPATILVGLPAANVESISDAIGTLCYNSAVVLGSQFTPSATGTYSSFYGTALKERLHFKGAVTMETLQLEVEAADPNNQTGRPTSEIGMHNRDLRRKVLYTNFDSGRPVILGIAGYDANEVTNLVERSLAGHAIVSDGYGFNTEVSSDGSKTNVTDFVHLNLGWSGQFDAWYNIPEVDTTEINDETGEISGYDFTVISSATYNIFDGADDELEPGEIISGRVVLEDGTPAAGAIISISNSDIEPTTTDDNGIYALVVPEEGSYEINAETADAQYVGSIVAKVDRRSLDSLDGLDNRPSVGNLWGNDIVVEPSIYFNSVRNERSGEFFDSLDRAYDAAVDGDTLVLEKPTRIRRKEMNFERSITIVAADQASPTNTPVYVAEDDLIKVDNGARLSLRNMEFRGYEQLVVTNTGSGFNSSNYTNYYVEGVKSPIQVAAGAKLSVAGHVYLPEIVTADSEGFVLSGVITLPISIRPPSFERGDKIGVAECSEADALSCAALIANREDKYIGVMPYPYPELRWELMPVSDEDCVAKLELPNGRGTFSYSNFDRMAKDIEDGCKITVVGKKGVMEKPVIMTDMSITVVGGGIGVSTALNVGPAGGFVVGDNSMLDVDMLKIDGYQGDSLFKVNGEGAKLVLGSGMWLSNIVGTNYYSGAVTVLKGTADINSVLFASCHAQGNYAGGYGGAIYLDSGAVLNINGCSITGCSATSGGGGIYAYRDAVINLKGIVTIRDNTSVYLNPINDNVLLYDTKTTNVTVALTGALTPGSFIGLNRANDDNVLNYGRTAGKLAVDCATDAQAFAAATNSFYSDTDSSLYCVVTEDGKALAWKAHEVQDGYRTDKQENDIARVIPIADSTNAYYFASLNEAFAELAEDGDILEMLADGRLTTTAEITKSVTIRTSDDALTNLGGPAWIQRAFDNCGLVIKTGAQVVIENCGVYGRYNNSDNRSNIKWQNVTATCPLIEVSGGSLVLTGATEVAYTRGGNTSGNRAVSGVVVWNGGSFVMHKDVSIHDCVNQYENIGNASGVGGGLLLDNGKATLYGGAISNCVAYRSAGVSVGNGSVLEIAGPLIVKDNKNLNGEPSDMTIENRATHTLLAALTEGEIWMEDGIASDTNVIGVIMFDGDFESYTNSAARYRHDTTRAYGMVATNAQNTVKKLVWSTAFNENGVFVDANEDFYAVGEIWEPEQEPVPDVPEPQDPVYAQPDPFAIKSIALTDGKWVLTITNAVKYCRYILVSKSDLSQATVSTNEVKDASSSGPMIFEVPANSGNAQFWRVFGEPGEVPPEQ